MRQAQGDLPGALTAYRAGLGIAERLGAADPSDAAAQRDLWVGYYSVATVLDRQGQPSREYWQRAYARLSTMKRTGLSISPEGEQMLAILRRKVEGGKF